MKIYRQLLFGFLQQLPLLYIKNIILKFLYHLFQYVEVWMFELYLKCWRLYIKDYPNTGYLDY